MMIAASRALNVADDDDEGFTLVELLVYMLLTTIVIAIVATIMINSFRVDTQVRDSAAAAGRAQAFTEALGRSVRNAGYMELTSPASGSLYLRTQSRDSGPGGGFVCDAWYFDGTSVRWGTGVAAWPASPDAAAIASWVVLADGVSPVGSEPVLALSADRRSLSVALTEDSADGVPVLVDTTIVSRQPRELTAEERSPCFGTP